MSEYFPSDSTNPDLNHVLEKDDEVLSAASRLQGIVASITTEKMAIEMPEYVTELSCNTNPQLFIKKGPEGNRMVIEVGDNIDSGYRLPDRLDTPETFAAQVFTVEDGKLSVETTLTSIDPKMYARNATFRMRATSEVEANASVGAVVGRVAKDTYDLSANQIRVTRDLKNTVMQMQPKPRWMRSSKDQEELESEIKTGVPLVADSQDLTGGMSAQTLRHIADILEPASQALETPSLWQVPPHTPIR